MMAPDRRLADIAPWRSTMVQTASTMELPLGAPAPSFKLPDTAGRIVSLDDFRDSPLLVQFICNHCPFVKHIRSELAHFARDYRARGLAIVGINANDFEAYPDDNPAKMAEEVRLAGYEFPYLVDESQAVAKAYRAACTPDFFLFDRAGKLAYRGQFDDSRPSNGKPVTGADLRRAADAVLAGQPVSGEQRASVGCNIKWKPGNAPHYFGS
jgi:thiol-disulfide isomerase/thioredoxin